MLIAQWQDAVTRKDLAEEFSFNEFRKVWSLGFSRSAQQERKIMIFLQTLGDYLMQFIFWVHIAA